MLKAIQIGSGNIGRGLNGYILWKNNAEITFLDVNEDTVTKLKNDDSYKVISRNETEKIDIVSNFKALNILEEFDSCVKVIAEADLVLISIGITNLPKIKTLLSSGLKSRISSNKINISAVENGINASSQLEKIMLEDLSIEDKENLLKKASFVNCAVDRIVPTQENNSLDVVVEEFYELIFDSNSWFGEKLDYVSYSDSLTKYIKRKLFMLNAVHSYIAWYGIKNDFKYIYNFAGNKILFDKVKKLLETFENILSAEYDFEISDLKKYSQKIISRLSNKYIKDNVERVGRGIIRKISPNDRFIEPLNLAIKYKLKYDALLEALAYPFSGLNFDDDENKELKNKIMEEGNMINTITFFTGLNNQIAKEINDKISQI